MSVKQYGCKTYLQQHQFERSTNLYNKKKLKHI